jgi:hypothetical protein
LPGHNSGESLESSLPCATFSLFLHYFELSRALLASGDGLVPEQRPRGITGASLRLLEAVFGFVDQSFRAKLLALQTDEARGDKTADDGDHPGTRLDNGRKERSRVRRHAF